MFDRLPLPGVFGLLLGTDDQEQWPPEATLLMAAYDGNVGRLKEIARGLDVNRRGVNSMLRRTTFKGMDVLHAAAGGKQGKLPICRYLVEEVKMDINRRDTFKGKSMTPLQHAVFSGNLPIVRYLLDHGADLHQEGRREGHDGFSALHTAAEKGRCVIAKLLLSRGAYVDGKSIHVTPLQLAVHGGHDSTLKILLDHTADPNKEVNLTTPLHIALRTPSLSCLKLLIQAGAEVNDIDNPLARAAQEGLTEAIKCLLEAGANPNTADWCGRFPIELAAVYGTREDVEILFPCTSPIPTVTDWSIDGIINHMELERKQREDDDFVEARKSDLKRKGDDAFKKQDYINSSAFYTQALKVDPYDAELFSNRSLCYLRTGDGKRALQDASSCKMLRPKWAKAYYRKGEALILVKDYEKACDTLSEGLELNPMCDELDKLYWEAMELKNGSSTGAA